MPLCNGDERRHVSNADVVRRFEEEFKNVNNLDIVDELMADDFEQHLPYAGLPPGRAGMKAVGRVVTGAFRDIRTTVELIVAEGELVADRIHAHGTRNSDDEPVDWVENHIYRVVDGRICELWPAGGPTLD
jgi:predicted SnoaL-like aldol condensation-catalyzing enzyme